MKTRFTVHGKRIVATTEDVEAALRDEVPERTHVYSVEVEEREFPVRQAMEVAFGLDRDQCYPHVARRVFRQLGLRIHTSGKHDRRCGPRPKESPLSRVEIGPVEDVLIELPRVGLGWFPWVRWEHLAEYDVPLRDLPSGESGVYEAVISDREERLTIGRASDLRARIIQGLIKGAISHTAGERIRAQEDLTRVRVRWALTERPAAIEEELHLRHIAEFGRLPKYVVRT